MDETTYELKHPVTRRWQVRGAEPAEETITLVTIRRLRAKDLRMLDKEHGKFAQSLALISALTGLPAQVVDDLDVEDIEGIGELMGDFFPGRLETGATS